MVVIAVGGERELDLFSRRTLDGAKRVDRRCVPVTIACIVTSMPCTFHHGRTIRRLQKLYMLNLPTMCVLAFGSTSTAADL